MWLGVWGAMVPSGALSDAPDPAGETAPPIVLGGQPSALLALLKAGNCHNPYLDTVENGSTLGKSGIHDPQLDPSPSNRPLIFWILTPCKKPGATGSAGRCDLGVGRFTDPHPLTCSFFTPLSTA